MYETAWGQVLAENAAEGKWQAEFQTFFGRSAPDVNNWNNLSNQDQMDMVAAWLRIYNDGVTAVNVPSGWISEAVSSRDLLFLRYEAPIGYPYIGYKGAASEENLSIYYNNAPEYSAFGRIVKIAWQARSLGLGIYTSDYINPVNYSGKSISEVGLAWVYVRDQQGNKHATFLLIPFAQQTLELGGALVHGKPDSGQSDLFAGSNIDKTKPVRIVIMAGGLEEINITSETSNRVWQLFAYARKHNELTWFLRHTSSSMFLGAIDVSNWLDLVAPPGYSLPPHP